MKSPELQIAQTGQRYLNLRELQNKLGNRARSTIYNDLAEKRLPPPIKLGGRVYWIEAEVDDWLLASRSEVTDIADSCTDQEDGLTTTNLLPRNKGGE